MESQNVTEDNKITLPSVLGEIEFRAMELKFEGYSMKEMANVLLKEFGDLSPSYESIRQWFRTGGKLTPFYIDYVKEQTKIRNEEARLAFKGNLKQAVRVVIALAMGSKSDMVRLMAAKELINRELGEPKKVVENIGEDPIKRILELAGIEPEPLNKQNETIGLPKTT